MCGDSYGTAKVRPAILRSVSRDDTLLCNVFAFIALITRRKYTHISIPFGGGSDAVRYIHASAVHQSHRCWHLGILGSVTPTPAWRHLCRRTSLSSRNTLLLSFTGLRELILMVWGSADVDFVLDWQIERSEDHLDSDVLVRILIRR